MKKALIFVFLFLGLAVYGQDQKEPYGLHQLTDTTAGTASAETFVLDNKLEGNWIVYRVVSPTLIGADSLKSSAQLKEANDYALSAYASVPGRTMTFSQKATAVPAYLMDTVSGLKQEITFTASIDSSASTYDLS